MGGDERSLLADAMVLIDFSAVDVSVLKLAAENLGPVLVLTPVLSEVDDMSERDCKSLGLEVVEPTAEELEDAANKQPGLSFEDRLCLAVAIRRECVCITNDRKLRGAIAASGGSCLWSLQVVLRLVERGKIGKAKARQIGRGMNKENPGFVGDEVLLGFEEKLDAIG